MLRILGIVAGLLVLTLRPFAPGSYDSLAAPLAMTARVLGITGLLLVFPGCLWIAAARFTAMARHRRALEVITVLCAAPPAILSVAAAASTSGAWLALVVAAPWVTLFIRFAIRWRLDESQSPALASMALSRGALLVATPLLTFGLQRLAVPAAAESARSRAIARSADFISAIERSKATHGDYPEALPAVWADWKTGVAGIERFWYAREGDSYIVWFQTHAVAISAIEVVVYSPVDRPQMTSHTSALLDHRGAQQEGARGYHTRQALAQPHWTSFLFD